MGQLVVQRTNRERKESEFIWYKVVGSDKKYRVGIGSNLLSSARHRPEARRRRSDQLSLEQAQTRHSIME